MLFILLSITYIFIILMSGSVEEKRLKEESKDWKRIFGREYYG